MSEKKTYLAGIDMGTAFIKVVILNKDNIVFSRAMPSGKCYKETAEKIMQAALEKVGLVMTDIAEIVATGYGAGNVSFASRQISDMSCQVRGARYLFPSAQAVIDIGSQSTKVIKLDEEGRMKEFIANEKCAAGNGRFLQVLARVLGVTLDDLGSISLKAEKEVKFTTSCAVFVESEVISRVAEQQKKEDIVAGAHASIANKVANLVLRIRPEGDCVLTGGGALNIGLVKSLKEKLDCLLFIPKEPQINAALGEALNARDSLFDKALIETK
ncbi:MAG: acyl-CoA dehydratase activase [Pseudomonadota bacterium]